MKTSSVEPTEAQYLIVTLDTLELLGHFYDEDTEYWYIHTPSPLLNSIIRQNGDIAPIDWRSELSKNQLNCKNSNIKDLQKF